MPDVRQTGLRPRLRSRRPAAPSAALPLPPVALPATGRTAVGLPEKSHWQHREFIELLLGGWVGHEWDPARQRWAVANSHFIALTAGLLRRYGRISVGREFNCREVCNPSCRNARGPLCTCSIRARNHGGGKWMRGWDIQGEATRVEQGRDWSRPAVAPKRP